MKRKTVTVFSLKVKANHFLENSADELINERKGVASFLANVLHDTGNYQGFNYLESESDLHAGHYGKDGRVYFY